MISKTSGFPGTFNPAAGVFRISVPRGDLGVSVNGIKITPGLGLTASAAFTGTRQRTLVVGEVPLLEDEVNGFLNRVIDSGIQVTALHNALLWDQPRVLSLHFEGMGNEESLASAVGALFAKITGNQLEHERPRALRVDASQGALNPQIIHQFLWKGEFIDGAYRISTGRGTQLAGLPVGKSMGVDSWASFAGNDENAIVNGDIALLEIEMSKVLKALINAHLSIVSIHTHLTQEVPRVMFVHFWGAGRLEDLVKGVKSALKTEKNFRGST